MDTTIGSYEGVVNIREGGIGEVYVARLRLAWSVVSK